MLSIEEAALVEGYAYDLTARNLTDKTKSVYMERIGYLVKLADSLRKGILELTKQEIQRALIDRLKTMEPVSINGYLKEWRRFYNWVARQGIAPAGWSNPCVNIPCMREAKRTHRLITPEEYAGAILSYKPHRYTGLRNQCIMLLAWDCMLRKNEILTLNRADIDMPNKTIRVMGKGRREAFLPFSAKTASKLCLHISRLENIQGDLLFPSVKGTKIDDRAGHRIFWNAGQRLTPPVSMYPHLIRRSAATHFWKVTGNIYLVSSILRHSSVKVTEQYVQASRSDIELAYKTVTPVSGLRL